MKRKKSIKQQSQRLQKTKTNKTKNENMSTKTIITESQLPNGNKKEKFMIRLKPRSQGKELGVSTAAPINKRAKLAKIKQRKEVLRLAGEKSRFPATTWDLIKKQVGCIRLKKETHPLLEQIVVQRMKAVLSRTLVVSSRKMLHASDIHTALDSLNSSVAI